MCCSVVCWAGFSSRGQEKAQGAAEAGLTQGARSLKKSKYTPRVECKVQARSPHTLPRATLVWETLGALCYRRREGKKNKGTTKQLNLHKFSLSCLQINREHVLPAPADFNGLSFPLVWEWTADQGCGYQTHLGSSGAQGATGFHSHRDPLSLILQCLPEGLSSHFRLSLENREADPSHQVMCPGDLHIYLGQHHWHTVM